MPRTKRTVRKLEKSTETNETLKNLDKFDRDHTMPRTKRTVRKLEKSTETIETLKNLDKFVLEVKTKIDNHAYMILRNLELAFKIYMDSINSKYLQKTVGQLKTEVKTLQDATSTRKPTTRQSRRPASHDDGYLTENSSQGSGERGAKKNLRAPPSSSSRTTSRRSRSADASARTVVKPAPKTAQRRRSRSVYRTPAYNKNSAVNYPAITPKVTPQTPLTVLRQPRQGEMVVSMSGSPVMVPSCYTLQPHEKANCNILLQDGTMLSLQPKQLRQSQAFIPFSLMDSDVLPQLRTLINNLDTVVRLGEKNLKK